MKRVRKPHPDQWKIDLVDSIYAKLYGHWNGGKNTPWIRAPGDTTGFCTVVKKETYIEFGQFWLTLKPDGTYEFGDPIG